MKWHACENPLTYSFCGRGVLSTYHLERHKLIHTRVKSFKCYEHSLRNKTLIHYLLLHTGERPL